MTQTIAHSISRHIQCLSHRRHPAVRVLSVGRHACNLLFDQDKVISLVDHRIGNGPFNVVVGALDGLSVCVQTNPTMTLGRDWLCLGQFHVDLRPASVWDPSPDWDTLRRGYTKAQSALLALRDLCARSACGSIFGPLIGMPAADDGWAASVLGRTQRALQDLAAGWEGDWARLRRGAVTLAGLGVGLTPSGDDLLVGAMLGAWLAHPAPERVCRALLEASAPRTTALSAAFLRAAARGQCSAPWHALLIVLQTTDRARIARATRRVLSHGATSGADALIGFLCFSSMGGTLAHEMSDQA
jgi:hypothetical protein